MRNLYINNKIQASNDLYVKASSEPSGALFLDDYPDTEYYYSLNRGETGATTDVCELQRDGAVTQNFTAEELQDGTLATFATGGEARLRRLINQGTVSRDFENTTYSTQPRVYRDDELYLFNGKLYFSGVETSVLIETDKRNPILDKDSTAYVVFRSQGAANVGGVFEEVQNAGERILMYSDTRSSLFRHSNYAPSSSNFISFSSQQPQEEIRLYALRKTGNTIEAYDESGLVASISTSDNFAGSAQTSFSLFLQTIGSLHFRGHIAEVIVREKSDDNATLQDIIDHRKAYYGIV